MLLLHISPALPPHHAMHIGLSLMHASVYYLGTWDDYARSACTTYTQSEAPLLQLTNCCCCSFASSQYLLPCGRNSIELSWHGRLTCFIYLNTPLLPHRLILPRHEDGNEDDDYDYDKYYSVSLSLSLSLPMHPLTVTGSKQLPLGWYKCGAFVVLWSVDELEQSE